jgi:hypothetical protein
VVGGGDDAWRPSTTRAKRRWTGVPMGPRIAAAATSVPLQYTLRPSTCAPGRDFRGLAGGVGRREKLVRTMWRRCCWDVWVGGCAVGCCCGCGDAGDGCHTIRAFNGIDRCATRTGNNVLYLGTYIFSITRFSRYFWVSRLAFIKQSPISTPLCHALELGTMLLTNRDLSGA